MQIDDEIRVPKLERREADDLSRHGLGRPTSAGETIFQRGDRGGSMFLIRSGLVELQFTAGQPSKQLAGGSFFGELSLIMGEHERTATAVVIESGELVIFDLGTLETILLERPALLWSLIRRTCAYLLESEQRLVNELQRQNDELRLGIDYIRRTRQELDRTDLMARTDELTGLYNRRCLTEELPKRIGVGRRGGHELAVVAIDLDGFKAANDQFGHAFGDDVLRGVADILREGIRRSDLPCRTGGDEFVVLLYDVDRAVAERVAGSLRRRVSEEQFIAPDGSEAPITASVGVAIVHPGEDAAAVLERADSALYLAKSSGRDRVTWGG